MCVCVCVWMGRLADGSLSLCVCVCVCVRACVLVGVCVCACARAHACAVRNQPRHLVSIAMPVCGGKWSPNGPQDYPRSVWGVGGGYGMAWYSAGLFCYITSHCIAWHAVLIESLAGPPKSMRPY